MNPVSVILVFLLVLLLVLLVDLVLDFLYMSGNHSYSYSHSHNHICSRCSDQCTNLSVHSGNSFDHKLLLPSPF